MTNTILKSFLLFLFLSIITSSYAFSVPVTKSTLLKNYYDQFECNLDFYISVSEGTAAYDSKAAPILSKLNTEKSNLKSFALKNDAKRFKSSLISFRDQVKSVAKNYNLVQKSLSIKQPIKRKEMAALLNKLINAKKSCLAQQKLKSSTQNSIYTPFD
ncbi:MAG: hypothetical protein AABX38_03420 [Candidatus Micrarchaeota archaeon]